MKNHQEQMAERMEQNLKIDVIEILIGLYRQIENDNVSPQQAANNLQQPFNQHNAMFQLLISLQNKVETLSNNKTYIPRSNNFNQGINK